MAQNGGRPNFFPGVIWPCVKRADGKLKCGEKGKKALAIKTSSKFNLSEQK